MNEITHIWKFDINRRVYPPSEKKLWSSTPIWKEHWVKHDIVGETSRSWLIGCVHNPIKVPKKGPSNGFAFSEEEVNELAWVHDNAYEISQQVRSLKPDMLKAVADLIGYSIK